MPSSGGVNRLPRKTIKINTGSDADDDDDEDEKDEAEAVGGPSNLDKVSLDQKVIPSSTGGIDDLDCSSKPPAALAVLGSALENHSGLILNITADSTKLKRKQICDTTTVRDSSDSEDSDSESDKFRSSSPERRDQAKTVVKVPDPTEKVSLLVVYTSQCSLELYFLRSICLKTPCSRPKLSQTSLSYARLSVNKSVSQTPK